MKLRTCLIGVVLIAITALISTQVFSQNESGETASQPQMTAEQLAEMQMWAKIGMPSEHHKHLNYFIGKWNTTTKMWMGGPGSDVMESQGTSNIRWVLDGRMLLDEHKGSMMGLPYEGIGMTGYDNYRNMYFSSWCSNMQTNMLTMTGKRHPDTGIFTYYGEMDEPSIKVIGRTVKYVTRIINENKYVFDIIDLHAGDDYKVIEITYTRK